MRAGDGVWTRRLFLQAASCAAVTATAARTLALPFSGPSMFAFVATSGDGGPATRIETYRVSPDRWEKACEVSVTTPVRLFAHPTLPVLYACHDVDLWEHLPRGAVSAYGLDRASGALVHRSTQPLSLAASHPRFATVTAKGTSLFVGTRAGISNIFPLDAGGDLLPVGAIRKEYGRAVSDASMYAVEHPDGTLLGADAARGILSRFRPEEDRLQLQQRIAARVRQLAVSRCGRWAYTLHADDSSVAVHHIAAGAMCAAHQVVAGRGGHASLLAPPCMRFLLRVDSAGVSVLPVDAHTGELSVGRETLSIQLSQPTLTPDGKQLAGFDPSTGDVVTIALREGARVLGAVRTVSRGTPENRDLAFYDLHTHGAA